VYERVIRRPALLLEPAKTYVNPNLDRFPCAKLSHLSDMRPATVTPFVLLQPLRPQSHHQQFPEPLHIAADAYNDKNLNAAEACGTERQEKGHIWERRVDIRDANVDPGDLEEYPWQGLKLGAATLHRIILSKLAPLRTNTSTITQKEIERAYDL
jgi:hypothetical protein